MASTCKALVTKPTSDQTSATLVRQSVPLPQPEEHQLLIKVQYVAQNPTDAQCLDINAFGEGAVLGCDFVGTVEALGPKVTRFSKEDTISGLIWGGEIKGVGGYSQYTIADESICFPVPDGVDLAAASTVPLASCTSLLALFSKDCLNIDKSSCEKQPVLIWGGSSSVGLYAVQIASLYGMIPIATCSPRHFDLVKSQGAAHVFDYRDADVIAKIKAAAPDLQYVFDTIGNETSSGLASQAITEAGGCLCTVRPGKVHTENVTKQTKVTDVLVWTAFLREHKYKSFVWPANEGDHNLSKEFFDKLPQLLKDGKITPNKVKLFEGLDKVPEGFQEYRDGKISAYKIVYKGE